MTCSHPECTGVHDNSRYQELCPRSVDRKRDKDDRYYSSKKGVLARLRKTKWARSGSAAYVEMEEFLNSGKLDERVAAALASDDPVAYLIRATFADAFGAPFTDILFPSRAA